MIYPFFFPTKSGATLCSLYCFEKGVFSLNHANRRRFSDLHGVTIDCYLVSNCQTVARQTFLMVEIIYLNIVFMLRASVIFSLFALQILPLVAQP